MKQGWLTAVELETNGSRAIANYSTGAVAISVLDTVHFNPAGGDIVSINGVTYTTQTVDQVNDIVTLASGLTAAVNQDDMVALTRADGSIETVKVAWIDLDGVDGDPLPIEIPFQQSALYVVGPYNPPVAISVSDDIDEILDLPAVNPAIDGGMIQPGSIPVSATNPDPLAVLIAGNGQAFIANETQVSGSFVLAPAVSASMLTQGVVWFDVTSAPGALGNGNYYVYNAGQWEKVTYEPTIALCAGLKFSQSPIGPGTLTLYRDPNATYITASSTVYPNASSSSAPSGQLTSVATLNGALATGAPIVSIPVNPTTNALSVGESVVTVSGSNYMVWTVSAATPAGSNAIPVNSQTPNFAYPSGSTVDNGFNRGDVMFQADTGHWFLYKIDASAYTGAWADWTQITFSSTIVMCEALSVASGAAADALSQAIAQLATDMTVANSTAYVQDLTAAFNAVLSDIIAQLGIGTADAGLASMETALDAAAVGTQSIIYATDQDTVATAVMGALAANILTGINNPADAQTLFSVTDEAYTGSASKINGANFLETYLTASATGTGMLP